MFAVRGDIDSDPHILVFTQITFHSTRCVEGLQDSNTLFLNGFNRSRQFFGMYNSGKQG